MVWFTGGELCVSVQRLSPLTRVLSKSPTHPLQRVLGAQAPSSQRLPCLSFVNRSWAESPLTGPGSMEVIHGPVTTNPLLPLLSWFQLLFISFWDLVSSPTVQQEGGDSFQEKT